MKINILVLLTPILLFCLGMNCKASQVYVGEPLGEALYDLAQYTKIISHPMSEGSQHERTDVFKLKDGRILAVTSKAKMGESNFSIIAIRVSKDEKEILSIKNPSVESVLLVSGDKLKK